MASENESFETTKKRLTQGGVAAFALKILSVGVGFVAQLLIARLLGTSGYGEFAFALVTLNFLVIGAVAGADSVATRFVSLFRDSPALLLTCWKWLNKRAYFLAAIYLVLSLAIIQWIRQFDDRNSWIVTQVICLALPFQVFSMLRQGFLKGRQRPVLAQIPEELVRPLVTLLLVTAAFYSWPYYWGEFIPPHVAAIVVIATFLALVTGQIFLRREMPRVTSAEFSSMAQDEIAEQQQEWRSMAWASTFAAFAMTIHAQCDVWMLGLLVDTQDVGAYAAAARYAAFVIFGINAVNTALAPLVASAAKDKKQLQKLASRAVTLSFVLSLVVSVVLLVLPELVLGWFGQDFVKAASPLRILVAANLFNVMCGSVGMLLNMTGHHRSFVKILLVSMLANIILNSTLIPLFSINGAAWATAISIAIWNICGWILVRKKLDVRPTLGGLV